MQLCCEKQKTTQMKKLTPVLVGLLLMLSSYSAVKAESDSTITCTQAETVQAIAVEKLVTRLEEINAMDKSNLKAKDKRVLRKEVSEIKNSLDRYNNGGVYISVGALIIIILLLIILL